MSLSLFQAELLYDPEFARNVKGLEGMLRVRERLGESSRVCVHVRNSASQSGGRDAGSVAPGVASVGIEGGCGPPPRVHSADGGVGDFSQHSTASTGCRGRAPCPAENTLAFKGTLHAINKNDLDDGMVAPSAKAGEKGESGLLEVIQSDFSSPLAHSKSLLNSSRVSSHVGCTGLALPSASACALAACTHGSCSAPSSAVVPLGFPVRPKICFLSQRLQVHFPVGNQAQVPGGSFLIPNSCHLVADWASGNQWAARRCVKPHSRGFGC